MPPIDPYPSKTPSQILTRRYLLDTFALVSDAENVIFPFSLLMGIPTIAKFLTPFRFFRAGMQIEVEIVSVPMQFGAIMISKLPYTDSATAWMEIEQQSQADSFLLDIGQQNGYEVFLPYLRPMLWHDLTDITDLKSWRIVIRNLLTETITVGAPASVTFNIFGSFVGPEAAGFIPEATFQSMGGFRAYAGSAARLFKAGAPIVQDLLKGNNMNAAMAGAAMLADNPSATVADAPADEANLQTPEDRKSVV